MGEPQNLPQRDDGELPDTLPTTPEGELFGARSGLSRDLLDIQHRIGHVQDHLGGARYGDPSKLGADRGRLALAARLLGEVTCTIVDLAFLARPEDEDPREAVCLGCPVEVSGVTRVVRAYVNCPVHGAEGRAA